MATFVRPDCGSRLAVALSKTKECFISLPNIIIFFASIENVLNFFNMFNHKARSLIPATQCHIVIFGKNVYFYLKHHTLCNTSQLKQSTRQVQLATFFFPPVLFLNILFQGDLNDLSEIWNLFLWFYICFLNTRRVFPWHISKTFQLISTQTNYFLLFLNI